MRPNKRYEQQTLGQKKRKKEIRNKQLTPIFWFPVIRSYIFTQITLCNMIARNHIAPFSPSSSFSLSHLLFCFVILLGSPSLLPQATMAKKKREKKQQTVLCG
jgi:hypothetical protein